MEFGGLALSILALPAYLGRPRWRWRNSYLQQNKKMWEYGDWDSRLHDASASSSPTSTLLQATSTFRYISAVCHINQRHVDVLPPGTCTSSLRYAAVARICTNCMLFFCSLLFMRAYRHVYYRFYIYIFLSFHSVDMLAWSVIICTLTFQP
jgi:hypothetical protein